MTFMSMSSGYRARVRRVLFVEDDTDVREFYARALRTAGFIVDEAGSITEAMASLRTGSADAIVLDRNLPDGDGLEAAPVLRSMHADIGIVAFTADPEWAARLTAKRCGCDAFVAKASAPAVLVGAVRSVLSAPLERRSKASHA